MDLKDVQKLHESKGSCKDRHLLKSRRLKTEFGFVSMTCPVCAPPLPEQRPLSFFAAPFELVLRSGDQEIVLAACKGLDKAVAEDMRPYNGIDPADELEGAIAQELAYGATRWAGQPAADFSLFYEQMKPLLTQLTKAMGILHRIFEHRVDRNKR